MNAIGNGSDEAATKSASGETNVHKLPMVSGAKFGLTVLFLYIVFLVSLIIGYSGWEVFDHYVGTAKSEIIGYGLLIGFPILIGFAGLITGIQKNRPGIGLLALLTTPIGFFFALLAENRSSKRVGTFAAPVILKSPIGVRIVSWAVIAMSAVQILTIFLPHIPYYVYAFMPRPQFLGFVTLLSGVFMLKGAGWARWLYIGSGAFGVVMTFGSGGMPSIFIYILFTAALLRKNSSEFFSRPQIPFSKPAESETTQPVGPSPGEEPRSVPSPSKKPIVNIINLRIIAERMSDCKLPYTTNMAIMAPDGLLQRAAQDMNLGKHLINYSESHSSTPQIVPEFKDDSERRRFFESMCSVPTWYCYHEHGGQGFRYNVLVELDEKTYRAAEATKQQDMPIEMALIDPDELRKALRR